MKEKVFAIDCDETIRANVKAMLEVYNYEFGTSLTTYDVQEYDVEKSFPLIQEKLGITAHEYFFHQHAVDVFSDAEVLPGALKALQTLSKYGKIYIVTWQEGAYNMKLTVDWLEENEIPHDGIFFSKDKSLLHADYLIDDCPRYFHGCNCKHAIMINRPYNMQESLRELKQDSNVLTIDRFSSLEKFAEWFESNVEIAERYE